MELVMGHRNPVCGSGARQSNEVFGADVGSKNRRPDNEPPEITACQKISVRGSLLSFDCPPC